jgi:hypothetical protein
VTEIASENNSTTIFPLPIDLFKPFLKQGSEALPSVSAAAAVLPSPTAPRGLREPEPASKTLADVGDFDAELAPGA